MGMCHPKDWLAKEGKDAGEGYWELKYMEGAANIVRVFGRRPGIDAAGKLMAKIREIEGVSYTEALLAAPSPDPV